jgi:MFS family permease
MSRSRQFLLSAVFSTSLGVGLIFGFEAPLIAVVLSRDGNSNFVIGAVNALSLAAVILVGPLYPAAIARFGLRRSVVAGVGAGAVLLALMPFWPTVPAWVVLRILTGAGLGLTWIASEVWMNRVAGGASRGAVMGLYGTVFSAGTVSGPLLLELTGSRGWPPFVIGAACLLVTLIPLGLLRTAASEPAQATSAGGLAPRLLLRAPVVMLAALVAGLVESADLSLLPLFGLHAGLSEHASVWLIAVFLAGNVALQLPIGVLADRFGRRRLLAVCALMSGVGPLLLPVAVGIPALLWPLLFLWGGTLYAFYAQGIALLGDEFSAGEVAAANTLFVMVYCGGGILGPSAGGLAMDLWPQHGLSVLLSGAAFALLAGLYAEPAFHHALKRRRALGASRARRKDPARTKVR